MVGSRKCKEHNCRQCARERVGRCFSSYNYGLDVFCIDEICLDFVDGRSPDKVTFETLGELKNYIREYFYCRDFAEVHTRKQLVNMLNMLYPHYGRDNYTGRQFTSMCKKRMVSHIEFYIKIHGLKCKKEEE